MFSAVRPQTLLSAFLDRIRRRSVEDRRQLVRELSGLMDDMGKLNQSYGDFQRSRVALKNLDKILAHEERRILRSLEAEEHTFIAQLENDQLRLIIEKFELELKVEMAQRRLDQVRNPPEKKERADPVKSRIDATLNGGGYSRYTEDEIEKLIKKYGGEENMPEDVKARIRNARRAAAEGDEGKS